MRTTDVNNQGQIRIQDAAWRPTMPGMRLHIPPLVSRRSVLGDMRVPTVLTENTVEPFVYEQWL